jgi:hypothetical protein
MKLYQIVLLVSLLFSFNSALAQNGSEQDDEKVRYGDGKTFGERLYFGGGLGVGFGNTTFVNISPLLGYRITERFSAGIRVKYQYFKYQQNFVGTNGAVIKSSFESNIYGGGVFSRLFVSNNIFLHGEYENLSVQFGDRFGNKTREWIPSAFIGGGYAYPIGGRAMFSITALYNVLYDEFKSPYASPLDIQAGISLSY